MVFALAGCGSTNSDNEDSAGSLFDSGTISSGGIFMYTFEQEGEQPYFCRFHSPDMKGMITVSAGAQSAQRDTVEMINRQFVPSQLTVSPNTEVVWINRDGLSHTVTSGKPDTGGNNTGNGGY